jgi:hypothetical protein
MRMTSRNPDLDAYTIATATLAVDILKDINDEVNHP